jgi:hypothetical protein
MPKQLEDVLSSEEILKIAEVLIDRKNSGHDWKLDVARMHQGMVGSYSLESIMSLIRTVRNEITSNPNVFSTLVDGK